MLKDDFNELIKKHLLSNTIFEYHTAEIETSKSEILDFLENILTARIREFDHLLEKCSKEIDPLKTNIVVAEFKISQNNLNEIQSKKEILKKDISNLIKMVLNLGDNYLNSDLYLFVNKVNKTKNFIDSYNVDYFNYTGGLKEELKYLKRILIKK